MTEKKVNVNADVDRDEQAVEKEALKVIEKGCKEAENTIKDKDKVEKLLRRMETELESIPNVGDYLASVPAFISLVRSYCRKEYTDVPVGTIIAIVATLTYFLSPVDLIPDSIPGLGYLDDIAVMAACMGLVKSDVDAYLIWREEHEKTE